MPKLFVKKLAKFLSVPAQMRQKHIFQHVHLDLWVFSASKSSLEQNETWMGVFGVVGLCALLGLTWQNVLVKDFHV